MAHLAKVLVLLMAVIAVFVGLGFCFGVVFNYQNTSVKEISGGNRRVVHKKYSEVVGLGKLYAVQWNTSDGLSCVHRRYDWSEINATTKPFRFNSINNKYGDWRSSPMLERSDGVREAGRLFVGNVDRCINKSKKWGGKNILDKARESSKEGVWFIDNGAYFAIIDIDENYIEELYFVF